MKIRKHPAAIAWNKWFTSDDGKACSEPNTIKAPASQRQYLENRLSRAFQAGWLAAIKNRGRDA